MIVKDSRYRIKYEVGKPFAIIDRKSGKIRTFKRLNDLMVSLNKLRRKELLEQHP